MLLGGHTNRPRSEEPLIPWAPLDQTDSPPWDDDDGELPWRVIALTVPYATRSSLLLQLHLWINIACSDQQQLTQISNFYCPHLFHLEQQTSIAHIFFTLSSRWRQWWLLLLLRERARVHGAYARSSQWQLPYLPNQQKVRKRNMCWRNGL